jgi:hypothetical protein
MYDILALGIATGYGLDESRQCQEFSLLHIVHTSSEAYPTSYPVGTGGKAAGT